MEFENPTSMVVVKASGRAVLLDRLASLKQSLCDFASRPPLKLTVGLSSTSRRISWLLVLFLHVFNALYTVGMAYVYHFMTTKTVMSVYRSKMDMMDPDQYTWITAVYAVVSVFNVYCAVSMVVWSCYYRRMVFAHVKKRHPKDINAPGATGKSKLAYVSWFLSLLKPFSVRGHLFDHVLLAQELMEMASQTYQAYSSSLLVSSMWINQMFAAVILFNCIANVVMGSRRSMEPGRRRYICTVIDLVLDFIWGFLLPAKILFNYIPIFVSNDYSFPSSFSYADTKFTNAMLEFKQFFIISYIDAFTTIYPYINMLSSLRNLKVLSMCDLEEVEVSTDSHQIAPTSSPNDGAIILKENMKFQQSREKFKSTRKYCFHHVIHILIAVLGFSVWVTSLHASRLFGSDQCDSDCKLQLHPWFRSGCACSVQEINCFNREITGEVTQITTTMQTLNAQALNYLVISHCPSMTMPNTIRRFPRLLGMQLYNVTLTDWPKEASLSLPYFPRLNFVYIVRSRFLHGLPDGLTYKTANNLQDLEFVASDIGPIPDDINTKWPKVKILIIEHCAMQTFPKSITALPSLSVLSLAGNSITLLPESTFASSQTLIILSLDGNPIVALPNSYAAMASWFVLTIQDTQLASLSTSVWTRVQNGQITILACNTPLCTNTTQANRVGCLTPLERVRNGSFPLTLVDSIRKIYPSLS